MASGEVASRAFPCTVSRCCTVFGDSGSDIDDAVTFDDLESVADRPPVRPAKLLFLPNNNLALLPTEPIVPACEALLPTSPALAKTGKHPPSPTALNPLAYNLPASLPKPKKTKTMNAPPSQM